MIVAIDAGHGGHDRGGQSLGTDEPAIVLPYAAALAQILRDAGHRVILTRPIDLFVSLAERARIANDADADLFLSLHANASDNAAVAGPWTIHSAGSEKGAEYAAAVQQTLARVLSGNPRAAYPDASPWVGNRRLAVLRQTRMPAILIELGFMTSAPDLARITSATVRARITAALACTLAGLPTQ